MMTYNTVSITDNLIVRNLCWTDIFETWTTLCTSDLKVHSHWTDLTVFAWETSGINSLCVYFYHL